MAQLKLDKTQEIIKTKEEMTLEMERKVAQIENDNFDQMNKKDLELKDLQERVYKANENLDKARVESANKLEQLREDERILREQTVDNMKGEFRKREMEWQRRLKNMDTRHKNEVEDLNKEMEDALHHQKDQFDIKVKSLNNDHEKELDSVMMQLNDSQKVLAEVTAEKAQQMFEHENEMKIQLTDLQRQLEDKFLLEKNEKIMFMNKDFEMKMDRKKMDHDQELARIKFQTSLEEQKVIRANNLNFELGKWRARIYSLYFKL